MELLVKPKNIIIVGGASGIGYETTRLFDSQNSVKNIIIASRNYEKLVKAKLKIENELGLSNKIRFIEFDITDCKSHIIFLENAYEIGNCETRRARSQS